MEHKHHSPTNSAEAASALAKDPVCGMSVDPATAKHRAEHGGKTFFFCSGGCRGKFVADPARYLAEPTDAPAGAAHEPRPPRERAPRRKPAPRGRDLHLPDASGDSSGPSRRLPDLRHGARAGDRHGSDRPERGTRRHDPALLGRARRSPSLSSRSKWAAISPTCIGSCRNRFPTGFSWRSRLRSRSGRAGRSSSAAGRRSRAAISTCSR